MAGVRGIQPNWLYVNLNGLILDDTYYFFVQSFEDPFNPSPVWMDALQTTPWSYPIEFLASGTLPDNIYFDENTEYRLQIRKGTDPFSSPLIWEINNYFPDGSSSSGPSGMEFQTDNQITNPQFSQVNFVSGSSSTADFIDVAPGWTLQLTGVSGTTVLTKIAINGDQNIVTNPPYALGISTTGWTSVDLIQTFDQNGALWANQGVALTFVARCHTDLITPTIQANLVPSDGDPVPLFSQKINSDYNLWQDARDIPMSSNADSPPGASTQLVFTWAGGIEIDITSIQLVGQTLPNKIDYAQETIERQIDQLYHLAYPIIPVGTVIDFWGFNIPLHYTLCNFGLLNRITYSQLFNTITTTETVTLTNTVYTFTVASPDNYYAGMGIEGTGIVPQTTIVSISGSVVTMSSAATVNGSQVVRFFSASKVINLVVGWVTATTFTVFDPTLYSVNMQISGIGIADGTIITAISIDTLTITISPTTSYINGDMSLVYFYIPGNGDGSTTFNTPELRDFVIAGSGGILFSPNNAVGVTGGSALTSVTLDGGNLPVGTPFNPGGSGSLIVQTTTLIQPQVPANTAGGWTQGTSVPLNFSVVQQTALAKKCIRFE